MSVLEIADLKSFDFDTLSIKLVGAAFLVALVGLFIVSILFKAKLHHPHLQVYIKRGGSTSLHKTFAFMKRLLTSGVLLSTLDKMKQFPEGAL